jgi:hypothetical protein
VRIDVTFADIDAGLSRPDACPIALAVRRQTGERVRVGPVYAGPEPRWRIEDGDGRRCVLPAEAARFARDFDRGAGVYPIAFDLPDGFVTGEG